MTTTALARPMPAPDVLVAHLGDETILLDFNTKHYFRLNESAAVIWRGVEQREMTGAIVARLIAQFEVTESEARAAVDVLVAELRKNRLLNPADHGE